MVDLKAQIDTWTKEGDLILIMWDFNDYIFRHRSIIFFSRLGLRELIIDKHGSEGLASTRSNK